MGIIGRYIDGLPDFKKDRIIEAQNWCTNALRQLDGSRCLVGNVENVMDLHDHEAYTGLPRRPVYASCSQRTLASINPAVGFDLLCSKYGKQRAVALCKARAAKPPISKLLTAKPDPSIVAVPQFQPR